MNSKVEELLASRFTDALPSKWRERLKFKKKETLLLRMMRHNFD